MSFQARVVSWRQIGVAGVLAAGMILSSALLSKLFVRVRQEQSIEVKGYAERAVTSDQGRFSCGYSARAADLKDAYADLEKLRSRVLERLKEAGFSEASWKLSIPRVRSHYRRDAKGEPTNDLEAYSVSEDVTVHSGDVQRIDEAGRNLQTLLAEGLELHIGEPVFLIGNLEAIKQDLMAEATAHGRKRAEIMAGGSGGRVGSLISAQQGVFQITRPASTETSSYGLYSTETIPKVIKAVVSLEYAID